MNRFYGENNSSVGSAGVQREHMTIWNISKEMMKSALGRICSLFSIITPETVSRLLQSPDKSPVI